MKKFISGFLVGTLLMFTTPAIASNIDVAMNKIKIIINGEEIKGTNILYNGTTYVPLRIVSESLGQNVNWDAKTNTVNIGENKNSYENMTYAEKVEAFNNNIKLRKTYTKNGDYYEEWEYNVEVLHILKTMTQNEKKDYFQTKTTELETKVNADGYWFRLVDENGGLLYSAMYNKSLGFLLI